MNACCIYLQWLCPKVIIILGEEDYSTAISYRYPLFADTDKGIYPHATSQYHARPKAKRGIAMLIVDQFPYLRKQNRVTNFSHAQTMFVISFPQHWNPRYPFYLA